VSSLAGLELLSVETGSAACVVLACDGDSTLVVTGSGPGEGDLALSSVAVGGAGEFDDGVFVVLLKSCLLLRLVSLNSDWLFGCKCAEITRVIHTHTHSEVK
jgi:hypothetical protein